MNENTSMWPPHSMLQLRILKIFQIMLLLLHCHLISASLVLRGRDDWHRSIFLRYPYPLVHTIFRITKSKTRNSIHWGICWTTEQHISQSERVSADSEAEHGRHFNYWEVWISVWRGMQNIIRQSEWRVISWWDDGDYDDGEMTRWLFPGRSSHGICRTGTNSWHKRFMNMDFRPRMKKNYNHMGLATHDDLHCTTLGVGGVSPKPPSGKISILVGPRNQEGGWFIAKVSFLRRNKSFFPPSYRRSFAVLLLFFHPSSPQKPLSPNPYQRSDKFSV